MIQGTAALDKLLVNGETDERSHFHGFNITDVSLSPPVPMELHISNRQKLLNSIRQHLSDASRPITASFSSREPGFYGAIDIATGKSILFAPRLPADYVWMGEIKPASYFQERYMLAW
ncbi:hypothetical protein F3Y22_tig00000340pilonHSYRG00358 [Hibiscus syriacus]|uniref:Aminopeptidase P N-terminal domain-containing protein n=1 Tax=Hibiscus syriacus TaxID=106335 RepID=A0A6A3D884_HIBSY|nr:hypothetical protein F3Y22_tig00000340pilonHSYRG00358 [Hibiscus syriacus]